MFFDAHVHLSELEETSRMRPLPGACLSSIHDPTDPLLMSRPATVLLSYGIHPLWIDGEGRSLAVLESLAASGRLAAVGEFGFDFYHERTPEQEQRQAKFFEAQAEIAFRYRLPVVLHVRRGMAEIFERTEFLRSLPAVILHCYAGTAEEGVSLLKRRVNAIFSFGTPLIKNFPSAQKALKELPIERLLFETDAPFQSPRGQKRTLPEDIALVYRKGAELLDIEEEKLKERVWRTAEGLFPCLGHFTR